MTVEDTKDFEPGLTEEEEQIELEDTLAADLEGTEELSAESVNEDNYGADSDAVEEVSPMSITVPLEDQEL